MRLAHDPLRRSLRLTLRKTASRVAAAVASRVGARLVSRLLQRIVHKVAGQDVGAVKVVFQDGALVLRDLDLNLSGTCAISGWRTSRER